MVNKTIFIIGMGPGLSMGIAERFGSAGYNVYMISRNTGNLDRYLKHLEALNIKADYAIADISDTGQLNRALEALVEKTLSVDVVVYNAVDYRIKHILEDTIEELTNGFKVSVGNILETVRKLSPYLTESKGALLLTGGASANQPNPEMGSISLGKAGVKNLAYQLHAALKHKGIYVGTITVGGWISPSSKTHSPEQIALEFWRLNEKRNVIEVEY